MNDERDNNRPRNRGKKPGGSKPGAPGRRPDDFRKGPPKGGKPFRADGGKKRFEKSDGEQGSDRSKRPYARPERSEGDARADRGPRTFKPDGARGDGKPFVKRAAGKGKPFGKRPDRESGGRSAGGGEHREWKPRPQGTEAGGAERPRREWKPRPQGVEAGGAERPRREWKPRPQGAEAGGAERPRRDGARSFGSKSHEGQRRSYGSKSHDDGPRKPFAKSAEAVEGVSEERIAKRLARAGIASRRDAEDLIAAGRVSVNGRKLDSPAVNVTANDKIEVDGTEIPAIERTRLFLFHKPAGIVTTNRDPEGRKTVFDALPTDLPRLMTIGRLDINTEGLLLLTNDGGLARVLELPATGWLRRYRVRVHGKVEEKALAGLKDGIAVDGVFYGAIEASLDREQGTNAWLTIGLREGKNREVKNILGALGLDVTRLIRISYGPFQLGELPEGHVLEIKGRMLRDQLGERLVEESGANFEAPIVNQFSNHPVRRESSRSEPLEERPKFKRDGERGRIGEGGLIKKRQRREGARDEALGKLSTRPDRPKFERGERPERPKLERGERPERPAKFGERPDRFASFADKGSPRPSRGGKREREQRPIEPPGQRKANVWMAPGARPIGAGRAAAEKAEVEARRATKKPFGKPGPRKPREGDRPHSTRNGPGKGGPRGPRGGGRS
ncbi:pseudouridine synthase [Mesorhizobium sp. VNQ89]|uniref:pseudouridine synthase n=1 Tax=Mesorhizobium quangtriensis TaxID=3157709 RepID=UPI0032B824E0